MAGITEYWPIITGGATLVGGGVTWLAMYVREVRKDERDDVSGQITTFEALLDRATATISGLEEKLYARDERVDKLLLERQEAAERLLELKLALADRGTPPADVLRTIVDRDPGLMWAKKRLPDGRYVMLRVSEGYARLFLKGPASFYDGKQDSEIWPQEVADMFHINDELVYQEQRGRRIEEEIQTTDGRTGVFRGRKYPVRLADGFHYIIGVGEYLDDDDAN